MLSFQEFSNLLTYSTPDIYEAATEEGVIFAGGAAQTVGAAGGYMTGGGHSPFAHFYGLAVDSGLLYRQTTVYIMILMHLRSTRSEPRQC